MRRSRLPYVVGGGPVGLGLAATLGKRASRASWSARRARGDPKGQNLTARSLEHFYYWDCADELRAARLLPPGSRSEGITAYESLAGEYWYAPVGREAVARLLLSGERTAAAVPDGVRAAHPGAGDGSGCHAVRLVRHQHQPGGRRRACDGAWKTRVARAARWRAPTSWAADGARSMVREQAGIASSGARLRPAHGPGGLPLARAERAPGALSAADHVPGAASGTRRATGGSSAGSTPPRPGSSTRPCRPDATAANFDVHFALIERAAGFRGGVHVRARGLLGPARQRRRYATGKAGCSSPGMRRTAIRLTAAYGLNTGT